ncbi:SDR family oxidoreductase [Granulosicoccus sp. 3-233]|uniref:SDR family oxidoreductase n=1 Tax=Granulosicoccus sp. 3-233 TaxID=3417969 RepID=UPI003D327CA0
MGHKKTKTRTIVITGCSRGLGRALVDEFVAAGHTVAGCSRSSVEMQELARSYPDGHDFRALDVADDTAVTEWSADVLQSVGVPDLLINNAGIINRPLPLWEIPAEEFQQLLAVNVAGVHHVIRALLPHMIEAGRGVIINLSSGWGRSVSTQVAPYCASKWAIEGLTRALAEELPDGLAAIPVSPGVIDTQMLRQVWGERAGGYRTPQQWARQAAPYLLGLNASHSGQPLTVPG